MMHPSNALHLPSKLHAGRVSNSGGFQVFRGAEFCEHLLLNAAFLCPCGYPARLKAAAVRITLQPDILLLIPPQLLRQLPHHTLACGRLQICQQGCQPLIHFMQIIHVSPSTFLLARRVPAQPRPLIYLRQC